MNFRRIRIRNRNVVTWGHMWNRKDDERMRREKKTQRCCTKRTGWNEWRVSPLGLHFRSFIRVWPHFPLSLTSLNVFVYTRLGSIRSFSFLLLRSTKERNTLTHWKNREGLSETRAAKILRKRRKRIVVRSHPRNGMKLNTQKTHSFLCVISMTKIYQQKLRKREVSIEWRGRHGKEWRKRKRSWQWEKGDRKWSLHHTCMAISRPLNVIRRMGSTIFLLSLIYCSWQFIPKWSAWVTRRSSKVSSTGHTQSEERKELKHEIYVTNSCSYHDPQ